MLHQWTYIVHSFPVPTLSRTLFRARQHDFQWCAYGFEAFIRNVHPCFHSCSQNPFVCWHNLIGASNNRRQCLWEARWRKKVAFDMFPWAIFIVGVVEKNFELLSGCVDQKIFLMQRWDDVTQGWIFFTNQHTHDNLANNLEEERELFFGYNYWGNKDYISCL